MGIGVEALQELRFAGQDVGMSMEGVDAALARLVRGSAEAARGQGEAKDAFRELGVSLTDGQGNLRDFDDILGQVADGLGNATSDADRLRLGFAVFGREGSKFAATMKDGSAGVEEMRQRARDLGGVLSRDQVEAADKADKAINGFTLAIGGLKQQLASSLIPSLTEGLTRVSRWIVTVRDLTRNSHIVAGALAGVGVALAGMIGGARLLMLGKAALLFAAIALAVDDVVTFARGGDSEIGALLDKFGGAGTAAATVGLLREAWQGVNAAFSSGSDFVNFLVEDYFGQLYRDGANLAGEVERIGNAAVWAGEKLLKLFGINVAGAGKEFDQVTERAERGVSGSIVSRDVDSGLPADVARAAGRGVAAPLAATGVSATRGFGPPPAAQAAFVLTPANTTPASAPVVNNNTTVNVNGAGMDTQELARTFERVARKVQDDNHHRALRAVRQVPP